MTVKELSQLYYLTLEIEKDRKKLEELKSQRGPGEIVYDDMPHGKGPAKSRVERVAVAIVDLEATIEKKKARSMRERARLEKYIETIPDSLTRLVFTHRFVDGMPWQDVADSIGGYTADGVKKICYRYLDRYGAGTAEITKDSRAVMKKVSRDY